MRSFIVRKLCEVMIWSNDSGDALEAYREKARGFYGQIAELCEDSRRSVFAPDADFVEIEWLRVGSDEYKDDLHDRIISWRYSLKRQYANRHDFWFIPRYLPYEDEQRIGHVLSPLIDEVAALCIRPGVANQKDFLGGYRWYPHEMPRSSMKRVGVSRSKKY